MKLYYIPFEKIRDRSDVQQVRALRLNILYMIAQAGSGHLGTSLSSLEVMYHVMMKEKGVFFSSKGHDSAALYNILMLKGVIPEEYLHTFRKLGGLPGHPDPNYIGIQVSAGSLGMGLSKAQGMVLGGIKNRVFVLLGDGELQEGQNWEAFRNIGSKRLSDITAIIDVNTFQCDHEVEKTSPFYNGYGDILTQFGWNVYNIYNGNNLIQIEDTFRKIKDSDKPSVVLCHTKKSHGMPWEDTNKYHSGSISGEDYQEAISSYDLQDAVEVEKVYKTKLYGANELVYFYKDVLGDIIKENNDVVVLSADLESDCGLTEVAKKYPERFFEFGISEQDMVSAAAGMAIKGKIPVVHSFSSFLCRRANEQIYNNCCDRLHIVYVGSLAGLLPYGPGVSHTCLDDVELMASMPDMIVMEPKTIGEIQECMKWAVYHYDGPVYIRLVCLPMVEGAHR